MPVFASEVDSWATNASMPTPRAGLGVAVVNGKIYAIGGWGEENTTIPHIITLATNEEYDPTTNTWTSREPLPTLRSGFAIAVFENKIYVMGGRTESYQPIVVNEVYDPLTDSWETKTPMPIARAYLDANTVGGKIYLIGGAYYPPYFGSMEQYNETQVYDPSTDSWATESAIPIPTGDYTSTVIDNKIYVIGGGGGPSDRCQIYNTENDTWTTGKPLLTAERFTAAAATTGVTVPKRLYVIGGYSSGDNSNGLNQIYDLGSDTWTYGMTMPNARSSLAVAVVNDVLYAFGGSNGSILANNEAYTPDPNIIPEFPALVILPLLIAVFSIAVVIKRKQKRK